MFQIIVISEKKGCLLLVRKCDSLTDGLQWTTYCKYNVQTLTKVDQWSSTSLIRANMVRDGILNNYELICSTILLS